MKSIMVHLDGSADDEPRLAQAEAIASDWSAHLTAVFTNPLPELPLTTSLDDGGTVVEVIRGLEEEARRKGDIAGQDLAKRLAQLSVPTEFRRFDGTPSVLVSHVEREARYADLFVALRPYNETRPAIWSYLVEAVLFSSGRGVLLVPPGCPANHTFATVLLAWTESREASRAVREGLDFIENSSSTIVFMVDPDRGAGPGSKPGRGIAQYLNHHGAETEVTSVESSGGRVGALILEQAHAEGADLVIMGAYGHSRLREWVLGGATKHILTASEFPILLAH